MKRGNRRSAWDALDRRRLVASIVVVFGLIGLVGCSSVAADRSGDSASSTSNAPAKGQRWTTVATSTGTGEQVADTAPFALRPGRWRIRFTVEPNSVGPVPFKWSLHRQGDPSDLQHTVSNSSCASCDGPQTNEDAVREAGSYYLHILTSRPWTVTVEQLS